MAQMTVINRIKANAKCEFVPVVPIINLADARARVAAWRAEELKASERDFNLVYAIANDLQMMIRIAENRGIQPAILDPIKAKVALWTADPTLANFQALLDLVGESTKLADRL